MATIHGASPDSESRCTFPDAGVMACCAKGTTPILQQLASARPDRMFCGCVSRQGRRDKSAVAPSHCQRLTTAPNVAVLACSGKTRSARVSASSICETFGMKLESEAKHTPTLILSLLSGLLGSIQFGWATGVINLPQKVIEASLDLGSTDSLKWSVVVAAFTIGGLVGAQMAGSFADKYGRKAFLVWHSVFFIAAGVLQVRTHLWPGFARSLMFFPALASAFHYSGTFSPYTCVAMLVHALHQPVPSVLDEALAI